MPISRNDRRGLSLTELLVASTIMVLIAGGMGSLAMTAHEANSYSRGRLVAAQHARVALDRIEQTIDQAVASEQFPVCLVVTEQIGSEALPQTLVVWSPDYDGKGKVLIRLADGREAIVGGSRIERG